tara:strand:- start:19484 stop:20284 length:801 start_codon:yes stop_codon:yes gene_type:complete
MSELRVNTVRSLTSAAVSFTQGLTSTGGVTIQPPDDERLLVETKQTSGSGITTGSTFKTTPTGVEIGPLAGMDNTGGGLVIKNSSGTGIFTVSQSLNQVTVNGPSLQLGGAITTGNAQVAGTLQVQGNTTLGEDSESSHTIKGDLVVTGSITENSNFAGAFAPRAFGEITESVSSGTLAGTPAVVPGSGNIASVSHNAGTYTVTFSAALASNEYTLLISPRDSIVAAGLPRATVESITKSTTGFTFQLSNHAAVTGTIVVAFSVMK